MTRAEMIKCATKISALFLLTTAVSAQDLPDQAKDATDTAGALSPLSETFIAGDSAARTALAAWEIVTEEGTQIRTARGQDAVDQAPPEAARYAQKSYVFPTGSIRVLEFKQDQGGMRHAITVETTLYMLQGEGSVEVAGETVMLNQGDVVSYPSGTLRGNGDATVVLWTVTGTKSREDSKAMVVRSTETTFNQLGYWNGPDGNRIIVTTAEELEDAPATAIRLDMRGYPFDGNSLVVTKNYKSVLTNRTRGDRDALLYITSGKMHFFQYEDLTADAYIDVIAGPGDAIRETAGRYHNWIRIEDSSFIGIGTAPATPLEPDAPSDY